LKERAISELEEYAVITAYLWLLFALFSLHKQLVQGYGISVWQQGFAIVNALIFGKVILVGQALGLRRIRSHPGTSAQRCRERCYRSNWPCLLFEHDDDVFSRSRPLACTGDIDHVRYLTLANCNFIHDGVRCVARSTP
jgi:hypothetical protein